MERISEPADPYEEAGLPSTDDALPGKLITGDAQDDVVVPGDRPQAVNQWGTTALEETLGEPLDLRLSHEEPDVFAQVDKSASNDPDSDDPYPADREERVGRIVDDGGGSGDDERSDMIATSVGTDGGGFSAEERAMHIVYDIGGEG